MSPSVTVVVPNYNHARYLPQRVESVLAQTYTDFELLLLDDASTDDSRDVLRRYAAADPRARCVFNDRNSGSPFAQWNRGLRAARGEFVWLAESDDYADPRLLDTLVRTLRRHPSCGLAYCQSYKVDGDGRVQENLLAHTADLHPTLWSNDFVLPGRAFCGRFLSIRNVIPNASAAVLRRSVMARVGYAADEYRLNGDWLTWVRVALASDVAFVAEPLNAFRFHGSSVRTMTRPGQRIREMFRVVEHILRSVDVPRRSLAVARIEAARFLLQSLFIYRMPLGEWVRTVDQARAIDPLIELGLVRRAIEAAGRQTARRTGIFGPRPTDARSLLTRGGL